MPTTALTFGTFDQLDAEHHFFLEEITAFADRLVVAIARDAHVEHLKGKRAVQDEQTRLRVVAALPIVDKAVLSDEALGSYGVIDSEKPDVIILGHDQDALEADLHRWMDTKGQRIPIYRLPKYATTPDKKVGIAIGLVQHNGKLLLLHRKDKNPMWDRKWEFPGGKIDAAESPEEAMRRELAEETGLQASNITFLGARTHDWLLPEHTVRVHLHCFHCQVDSDAVVHEEQSAYGWEWVALENVLSYDLHEPNANIIRYFKDILT